MTTWQQLSVSTTEQIAPAVADLLDELGALSVTYMDASEQPLYEPQPGATPIWKQTRVIGLFTLDVDLQQIQKVLTGHFVEAPLNQWHQELLADQVWERAWMEHYRPMKFGERLWVCPTGQEHQGNDSKCLILDPGLAFGTGTHPTTALCLEWLASHDLVGKTLIDYGCGSGILAVAAILLGARQAYAIDIDPQALTATQANAEKNRVQDSIQCFLPEHFPSLQADIVLANILARPLIDLATRILALLDPGGQLILSGILNEQAESVILAYADTIKLHRLVSREEWCRIDGEKTNRQ